MESTDNKIKRGVITALKCFLIMSELEAESYYESNINTTLRACFNQILYKGRTDYLPPVLVVKSQSCQILGEQLSNLYEIGYRLHGSPVISTNNEVIQLVQMKEAE